MSPSFLLLPLDPLFSSDISSMSYIDDSDLLVKVVHVNDTTRVSLLSDNTKSIRSATWDPTGKYLVRLLFLYLLCSPFLFFAKERKEE
jgi:hypothetical protein